MMISVARLLLVVVPGPSLPLNIPHESQVLGGFLVGIACRASFLAHETRQGGCHPTTVHPFTVCTAFRVMDGTLAVWSLQNRRRHRADSFLQLGGNQYEIHTCGTAEQASGPSTCSRQTEVVMFCRQFLANALKHRQVMGQALGK